MSEQTSAAVDDGSNLKAENDGQELTGYYSSMGEMELGELKKEKSTDNNSEALDQSPNNGESNAANTIQASPFPETTTLVQICYLSIFAILGALLRIVVAQLFGEACRNPESVGWLASGSPLCVTADGETSREGGIIFADLPANMLGSFIMGFFQDAKVLQLPIDMSVGWLPPTHSFQSMSILHLAMKTGFCGSLTTFSSWNSAMVVMIFGTGDISRSSQVFRALFGYLVGMETALGSFVFGTVFATWIHNMVNPLLYKEKEASKQRKEEGVYINKNLPDFERRFLPNLSMESYGHDYPVDQIQSLERWRVSTMDARRVGHQQLQSLIEIEDSLLIRNEAITSETREIAQENNWNIDALSDWVLFRSSHNNTGESIYSEQLGSRTSSANTTDNLVFLTLQFAATLVIVTYLLLFIGLLSMNEPVAYAATDRTTCYALLLAPFGALSRWWLSKFNGKLPSTSLGWLPAGTFTANIAGSFISIVTVALEYRLELNIVEGFWLTGTLRAIRIGFSGCLTTVSSFVGEVHSFNKTRPDNAYQYIILSLGTACILSCAVYGPIALL